MDERPDDRNHPSRRGAGALLAALLIHTALSAPVSAMPIPAVASASGASVSGTSLSGAIVLKAADHAELPVRIVSDGVSRIALADDRIVRVVRSPGGLQVEHDPGSGSLYLRPLAGDGGREAAGSPVPLFIGTEKGFTYRLVLTLAADGAAQILIRNPEAVSHRTEAGEARIAALAGTIRAVVRRAPLPGWSVEPVAAVSAGGLQPVEVWRGPRLTALVFELGADGPADAAAFAARLGPEALGPGIAAAWMSARTGMAGRLAVAVRENAPMRRAGAGR